MCEIVTLSDSHEAIVVHTFFFGDFMYISPSEKYFEQFF
jgi:hypothetical protein